MPSVPQGAIEDHQWASVLNDIDETRKTATQRTDPRTRVSLGQFFTPMAVARFMAEMFTVAKEEASIIDTGAGVGVLSAALVCRLVTSAAPPTRLNVVLWELETQFHEQLTRNMELCKLTCRDSGVELTYEIIKADFITASAEAFSSLAVTSLPVDFDYAILNPPYKKLNTNSPARRMLSCCGIEVNNLYSAFLALAARWIAEGGELVAITPRSFCSGPYFKAFRRDFLSRIKLDRIHVYDSRSNAFSDDEVLQENIVFHGVKSDRQVENVMITTSSGPGCPTTSERSTPITEVLHPRDPELVIHIIESQDSHDVTQAVKNLPTRLYDLGLTVSTGRVVDFRAVNLLRTSPSSATVPLIYPHNLEGGKVIWPKPHPKKASAIDCSAAEYDLLIPNETYVLVKRFSAKEENRRIVAAVYYPDQLEFTSVGFENHLNYFHVAGRGLTRELARGLAAYLNSTVADKFFRTFNGHTQVNAGDLRRLHYPTTRQLISVGEQIGEVITEAHLVDQILDGLLIHA